MATDGAPSSSRTRLVVVLGVLVALVLVTAVGVVVLAQHRRGRSVGSAPEPSGAPGAALPDPGWNAVVATQPESGELVVYDKDGNETGRIETGLTNAFGGAGRGSFALFEGDDNRYVVVDVASGDVVWRSPQAVDHPQWADGTAAPVLLVPSADGDITVVDFATGNQLDLGDEEGVSDPLFQAYAVQLAPDGTLLATYDSRHNSSVIADLSTGDASSVAGVVHAVTDDGAIAINYDVPDPTTAQFVSRSGAEVGAAPVPLATESLLPDGTSAVVGFAEDRGGPEVFRTSVGDAQPTSLARPDVDVASAAAPVYAGAERLVVHDDRGLWIFDAAGHEVAQLSGQLAPAHGATSDARCLPVRTDDADELVDLATGGVLASVKVENGSANLQTSADGCVLAGYGVLLTRSGPVPLDGAAFPYVSADGSAALVKTVNGLDIIDLTRPGSDPVTVDSAGGGFVER